MHLSFARCASTWQNLNSMPPFVQLLSFFFFKPLYGSYSTRHYYYWHPFLFMYPCQSSVAFHSPPCWHVSIRDDYPSVCRTIFKHFFTDLPARPFSSFFFPWKYLYAGIYVGILGCSCFLTWRDFTVFSLPLFLLSSHLLCLCEVIESAISFSGNF